jgi:hypothetical protein
MQHIFLTSALVTKGRILYDPKKIAEVYAHEQRHVRNGTDIANRIAWKYTPVLEHGDYVLDADDLVNEIEDDMDALLLADAAHQYPSASAPIPADPNKNPIPYGVIGTLPGESPIPYWVDPGDL